MKVRWTRPALSHLDHIQDYVIAYRVFQTIEFLAVMHGAQQWPDKFD